MLDVAGLELMPEERELLLHPAVGGVILFARNYSDPVQLAALTASIHDLRTPPLPIAVDHEGGRVQRFREGFTRLPPMRSLGRLWNSDPAAAREAARATGFVLAAELRAHGVDFSFTPVLDLDHGRSGVIGDRAFHSDPQAVSELAGALVDGLGQGGCAAVGKHFPGHGWAEADSHTDLPVDPRSLAALEALDLVPFERLSKHAMAGIMPAHVLYPEVDSLTAGYSRIWLQDILRGRLGFGGIIFSDDLTMVGAHGVGGIVERGRKALDAGCDVMLVCNDPRAAAELAEGLHRQCPPTTLAALARLHGRPHAPPMDALGRQAPFRAAREQVAALRDSPPA
jgi:beta-N-acetylhexosaminidase